MNGFMAQLQNHQITFSPGFWTIQLGPGGNQIRGLVELMSLMA